MRKIRDRVDREKDNCVCEMAAHNLERGFKRDQNLFIGIGCNSLKSLDSEK
jgi:hypothetical protein